MSDRLTAPKTFLIGVTNVDREGLRAYLQATGNEDFEHSFTKVIEAGVSPAEALCSFYAKLCYKSLTLGQNANVNRIRDIGDNIKGCFDMGHGSVFEHVWFNFVTADCSRVFCFAEDTEILTSLGWVSVADITKHSRLLTRDPATGRDGWNTPKRVHSFDYTGKLISWQTSQGASPAVTDNHLLYAAPYDLRRFRGLTCEEIVLSAGKINAAEVYGKRIVVDNSISLADSYDFETIEIGDYKYSAYELFCWLGWMATDGGFSKDCRNQCNISQSKTVNWADLEYLMSALFGDRWCSYGPYPTDTGKTSRLFRITDPDLAKWAKSMIGPNKLERDLTPLLNFSRRLLRGFIECAIKGDGNVHAANGHEVIYCPSQIAAGQYQVIISMLGKCAMVREDDRGGESHMLNNVEITNRRPCYVVSISRKSASLISCNHWVDRDVVNETVYCPETDHGLVFVRHADGGLPVWSGNTHELVRHRVGTAFSQTSGRYVRIEPGNLKLVWDPILEGCEDIFEDCIEKIEETVYLTECRLGLRKPPDDYPTAGPADCLARCTANGYDCPPKMWVPDSSFSMTKRKKITSAIRRLAPNGQVNEMGWSANLRCIRQLMQIRTSRHAEYEIRLVFNQVYQLLKDRFPLMFYGAQEEEIDGLLEITGMKLQPWERILSDYSSEELADEMDTRTA